MVKRCAYGTCRSDTRYPERVLNVTFHPFPKPKRQLERCKRWIKACGRPHSELHPGNVTKDTYVCSKHFKDKRGLTEEHPDPIPLDIASAPPCSGKPGRKSVVSYEKNMDDAVYEDHTAGNGTVNEGQVTQSVSVKPEPLSEDEFTTNGVCGSGSDWKIPCDEDNSVNNNELLHEGPDSFESVPLKSEPMWSTASCWNECEKDKLQEEAARRTRVPSELDSAERQAYVRSLTQEVKDMCDKLEEVGVESVVMLLDRRTFHCLGLGSSQGQDFLNIQANTKQQFSDHCTGHNSTDVPNGIRQSACDRPDIIPFDRVHAEPLVKIEQTGDHVSLGSHGDSAAKEHENQFSDNDNSRGFLDNGDAHEGSRAACMNDDDDSISTASHHPVRNHANGDLNNETTNASSGVHCAGRSGVHSTGGNGVHSTGDRGVQSAPFAVLQVLSKRRCRGQTEYQVLWLGDLTMTWEPASSVPPQLRRGIPYASDSYRGGVEGVTLRPEPGNE